ncbi:MAG: Hsp20/alpha crystallin family protein [Patescibacteria group bacterium]|nr:Hsp20/alpha crystallin family protein [Patescibacteria group bacterium]MDE1946085.1 Hsp20/alpha crystallin family protein [Patescibacteria group bacterium]
MAKKSFFEKLTGMVRADEDEREGDELSPVLTDAEEETDGELAVDMYQTPSEVVIKTMVAGVRPEDLDISITRDMVTIKGHREDTREASDEDFFHKELYWGSFSRTITLPAEIEVEEAEATNKNGLLTLTLPKIDRNKQAKVKIKSV